MQHNKIQILFILLAILATLYAVNIFFTKSIFGVLIGVPAKVSFVIIDAPEDECENCFDAGNIVNMVDAAHDVKYKSRNVSYDSALSRKYIEMYDIKNLPAVVVSGDIENEKVVSAWSALSGQKKEDKIIIENLLPYYDIADARVKGLVNVVLLKDKTCGNCFDEEGYINILERFGVVVVDKKVYDIASLDGKEIAEKYNITKIPAMVLSRDARDYKGFFSSWGEVGTVEEDGWLVFREVQKFGLEYKSI